MKTKNKMSKLHKNVYASHHKKRMTLANFKAYSTDNITNISCIILFLKHRSVVLGLRETNSARKMYCTAKPGLVFFLIF